MIEYINLPSNATFEVKALVEHHNKGVHLRKDILANCELLSLQQMQQIVLEEFSNLHSYFLDKQYRIGDVDSVLSAIKYSQTKRFKYQKETFDCDDFATVFKSELVQLGTNAVGIVIDTSGKHAYSTVVYKNADDEPAILIVEPQIDELVNIGEGRYKAQEGYIIF